MIFWCISDMMNETDEKGISMENKYLIASNIISGILIGTSVAIIANKVSYNTFENKLAIDRIKASFECYHVIPTLQYIKEKGVISEVRNKNIKKATLSLKNKNIDINRFFFKEHTYFYKILYEEILSRLESLHKTSLDEKYAIKNKEEAEWLISHYIMLTKWNRKMYKFYLQELYERSNQLSRKNKIKAFLHMKVAPYFWL
jgi:hypothetical protein